MKKNLLMLMMGLSLSGSLAAQEPGSLSVSLAVNQGFDSTKEFTGNRNGLAADVAFDLKGSVPVRFGLGTSHFQSGTRNYASVDSYNTKSYTQGEGISLNVHQVYAALRTQPLDKTMFSFGLSMNRIQVGEATGKRMVKGWKGGARLDLEQRFSDRLTALLGFQVVEVGLDEVQTALVSPSWVQVGVRYHF